MDADTIALMDRALNYIREVAFSDSSNYMRNIKTMKFNTDLEWFNCSCIAMQRGYDNSVNVNTLGGWESTLSKDNDSNSDDMQLIDPSNSVKLLKPIYYANEHLLSFNICNTYYFRNLRFNKIVKYTRKSKIQIVLEKFKNYDKLLLMLKDDWQDIFLKRYLENFDFYYSCNDKLKDFYINSLKYAFGGELHLKNDVQLSKLENEKMDPVFIYANIHNAITTFHVAFEVYLNSLSNVYRLIHLDLDKAPQKTKGYIMLKMLEQGESIKEQFAPSQGE